MPPFVASATARSTDGVHPPARAVRCAGSETRVNDLRAIRHALPSANARSESELGVLRKRMRRTEKPSR